MHDVGEAVQVGRDPPVLWCRGYARTHRSATRTTWAWYDADSSFWIDPLTSHAVPMEPPLSALEITDHLTSVGVWHILSRNEHAVSCPDAAKKRNRLGHKGIPLGDELKSFLGRFHRSDGQVRHFVAHCRGDEHLDLDRVRTVLNATEDVERVSEKEALALGVAKGLVNPFKSTIGIGPNELSAPVTQVFDDGLLNRRGVPGTMMTNAGDYVWGVEFFVDDYVRVVPDAVVGSIAVRSPKRAGSHTPPHPIRPIGIITGNAPESGIALWTAINDAVRSILGEECLGDLSMPPVIVRSLPEMGLTMELDTRHTFVWSRMSIAVHDLCRDGARLLAVPCNTSHFFCPAIREIAGSYGAEFVSIAEVTADWLTRRGVRKAALVGINYVSDLGPWSGYRAAFQDFELEPLGARAASRLHKLAYRVKVEGATEACVNQLRDILRDEVTSDYVILALTELSILLDRQRNPGRSGRIILDPLDIYARAVACKYLEIPYLDEG